MATVNENDVLVHPLSLLGGIAESDNATYTDRWSRSVVCLYGCLSVCLSVTLVHPAKAMDRMRCHLAGTLVWSHKLIANARKSCIVNRQTGVRNSKYALSSDPPAYWSRDTVHAQWAFYLQNRLNTIMVDSTRRWIRLWTIAIIASEGLNAPDRPGIW